MHHTHVHEDFLLMYILFARRNHEHEDTLHIFISFALMHIAKIHVTHCLVCHVYAFTCSYIPYLHDYIHVGRAYSCYMSFQSFTCYYSYLLPLGTCLYSRVPSTRSLHVIPILVLLWLFCCSV